MQTQTFINRVILVVTILIIVYLTLLRVDKFLKIKAIDDCGKISKYEKTIPEENAKVSYPVLDQYKSCLKDKGY
jgi:hypothetical protein